MVKRLGLIRWLMIEVAVERLGLTEAGLGYAFYSYGSFTCVAAVKIMRVQFYG